MLKFLLRLAVLMAGLVFAACLVVLALALVAGWCLRYAFARLAGRPVTPFVVRMDRFGGFGGMARGRWPQRPGSAAEPAPRGRREIGDVTDVEAKPPRA